jgi:hypothetical protein
MTERRHTTDLIAERRLNLRRGGELSRLNVSKGGESSRVHAVRAAYDDDNQLVGGKRERTRNLCSVTANSAGGISSGLGAGRELLNINPNVMIVLDATAEHRGLLVHIHVCLGHQLVVCRRHWLCHNLGERDRPWVSGSGLLTARLQAGANPVGTSKDVVR